jgi:hypothetical protein
MRIFLQPSGMFTSNPTFLTSPMGKLTPSYRKYYYLLGVVVSFQVLTNNVFSLEKNLITKFG